MEVAQAFKQRFGSNLPIQMENYPPPPNRALLAQFITILQYATIAFAIAGKQMLDSMGIYLGPEFWAGVAEKRWTLILGAFFFGNSVINAVVSTGAFEITYGNDLVFSKIDTGRMPTMDELMATVQEAMSAAAR